jgi:hypothetical protein
MLDINENIDKGISLAVNFIKDALNQEPSYIVVESGEEEKEPLLLDKDLNELSFTRIRHTESDGRVGAVDGGSATVAKGRSFLIVVYRAASVIFQNGKRIKQRTLPLKLEIISQAAIPERYSSAYKDLTGEVPSEAPGIEKMLDRLRLFSEWMLAQELLDELNRGDMLLIDGSLKASIAPPHNFFLRITQKAKEKGVHLVGVSKTSTLYWGDRSPLIPAVVKVGERFCPDCKWFCRISAEELRTKSPSYFGTIYVARLKASSDFSFRIDVNRFDPADPQVVFSFLSNLSGDPAFLGYPYPLAAAHNLARITAGEVQDIKYRLQSKALEKGISTADWDLLFTDFHEVLNADLNR